MNTRVLLVMPRCLRGAIMELLDSCPVELLTACNCEEARRALDSSPVQVIMVGTELPDGVWRDFLGDRAHSRAAVIVCADRADQRLWTEVFERGAYDLLVPPYERQELQRVIQAAAALAYMRSLGDSAAAEAANG